MSQAITTSRIQVIEKLFREYPDIPQEIVIKQDLLRLGQGFSDSALAAAAGAEKKNYGLFGDMVPMSDMRRQEYLKISQFYFIKGGPYKLRPFSMRTKIAAGSPYLIDVIDGRLKLLLDGVPIADVGYRPPPFKYYAKSFPDGTSYRDIIDGGSTVHPFRLCQFWGAGEECKFCDINENARQVKNFKADTLTAPVKPVEQVEEVANEIGKEVLEREGYPSPIRFHITGGSIITKLHGLREDDFYLRYVEAIKRGGPRRYVDLQTNAPDKETMKGYRHRGVDSYCGNLEVWDKRLFEWICPGKARRVGWEEWVKRLVEAVDIFGEGNVRSIFVCGVEMAQPYGFKTVDEAVKSTTEGINFLMSHGVDPELNPWSREAGAYLQKKSNQPPVPPEFYLQLLRNYYENWKRYELPLINLYTGLNSRVRRSSSISDGYLLLMEQKDYENWTLQALERAGVTWSCS